MTMTGLHRVARTDELMGTVASIHVMVHADAVQDAATQDAIAHAVEACFVDLHDVEHVFSTFRHDSDISRLRRGELTLQDADPRVALVHAACADAKSATSGLFDAWQQGWFDPTGYVKGWAAEAAARTTLLPLLRVAGIHAAGLGVGGDLQLFTAPGSEWVWRIGIADPARPGGVAATVEVVTGAVATSGTAERGSHIVDPRTGTPTDSVASATVVADGLASADLWATTAVIAGFDDLSWIAAPGVRSGLVIAPDGRVRRWAGGVEVSSPDQYP